MNGEETLVRPQDENLLKTTFLDKIAEENRNNLEEKRLRIKTELSQIRIRRYLAEKFPHAKNTELREIAPREFPIIAKKARNYLVKKIATSCLYSGFSVGSAITSLVFIVKGAHPENAILIIGGILGFAIGSTLSGFAINNTIKRIKKFFKDRYYY